MKNPSTPLEYPEAVTRLCKLVALPGRLVRGALVIAAATAVGSAAVITPQLGGFIDPGPAKGEDMDYEATGSATLASFEALGGKVIQANWSGISGQGGNTVDHADVDVRIDHSPVDADFAATTASSTTVNSSDVGSGYKWTGKNGQQLTIKFGTQDGSFSSNRTVRAAGLMLLNFGAPYTGVTISYFDAANAVLSTQNFAGGGDSQNATGADVFTGYISSSQNIAKITIAITRAAGTSTIGLDAITYVAGPELESTSPADNATNVAPDSNLTATFNRNIVANTGSIELRLRSDDSLVESFDVTSQVTIVDDKVTLDPSSDLAPNSEYYVLIPDGAFKDASGANSAGVTSSATWSFSTEIPDSSTVDFDPTGEFAAEFSAGGYTEDATGGLGGSVGVATTGVVQGVTSLDGPQRSWFPSGTFSIGAKMTVGAFFKPSSLAAGEVYRLGLTNGGADTFASLPYGSILWDGTEAQLDVRTGVATDPVKFALSAGQWYYFEVSFTRGASNSITYDLAVANADASGNVGGTIKSFSHTGGTDLTTTELNLPIYAGFRGMLAAGVLDDFYASSTGLSKLSVGASYAGWIGGFPGVGTQTGVNDDPDGDGIDNGVENFFGTAPDEFSTGLVSGAVGANSFTFTHPQGSLAADLVAAYSWSKDLATFHGDGETDTGTTVDFTVQADTPVAGTTTVTATITGTAVELFFVRVEVSQ